MKEKSKPRSISRRKFLKDLGTGVAGSAVIIKSIHASPQGEKPRAAAGHQKNRVPLSLTVNGKTVEVQVESQTTLAELLRNHLQLAGTKVVCNHGECGACTVLMNGKAVYSCHILALDAAGSEIVTVEGLLTGEKLHPIQEAFVEHDGLQCGFCTPGQIMSAQALLLENPHPTRDEVLVGMSGNLCRCAAYPNIIKSVLAAAEAK